MSFFETTSECISVYLLQHCVFAPCNQLFRFSTFCLFVIISEACYLLQFEDLLFLCVHHVKVIVNDEFLQSKWAILLSSKVVFFSKNFSQYFSETYSESCQICKMECFAKINNEWILKAAISAKKCVLDISSGSEYASVFRVHTTIGFRN